LTLASEIASIEPSFARQSEGGAGKPFIERDRRVRSDYSCNYRNLWERHWWWRAREHYLRGWIERIHRQRRCERILDVGCGDGLFFDVLSQYGEVEGIEPDSSLLSESRWRPKIRNVPLDHGFDRFGQYDLVLMLDVLEHIESDEQALRQIKAAVRPGGSLLITVPALSWLWSAHDVANAHFRRYHASSLRLVLQRAGFEVKVLRYFFFWTVAPLVARRWLAPATPGSTEYSVSIPASTLNQSLIWLCRVEQALGRVIRWPLGTSLLAVARRPGTDFDEPRDADCANPETRGCSSAR